MKGTILTSVLCCAALSVSTAATADEFQACGLLKTAPRIVAVQAANCAPIAAAFAAGKTHVDPVTNEGTRAAGIAIAAPLRGSEVIAALRRHQGIVLTADERAMEAQHHRLASAGLQVEITTAATFAALDAYQAELSGTSLLPVCGTGLKGDLSARS